MTGLRQYERDAGLPERAGEPGLAPLTEGSLVEVVRRRLLADPDVELGAVRWEYARWKPGVNLTSAYRITLGGAQPDDSGAETEPDRIVVVKRYADGKHHALEDRLRSWENVEAWSAPFAAQAVDPETAALIWTFPGDRVLRYHELFLNPKKLASLIKHAGLVEPGRIRRRRLRYSLLRYKPERRSVWKVRLKLRPDNERRSYACRMLPPEEAQRVLAERRRFAAQAPEGLTPELAGADEQHGILIEPWLELREQAPDSFEHASEAGEALARLHAVPLDSKATPRPLPDLRDLRALLACVPGLADRPLPRPPEGGATTWTHGDFHPDQVAKRPDGTWVLLDLDLLAPGDPDRDLASWIADALYEDPQADFATVAAPLLDSYSTALGRRPDPARLAKWAAVQLVQRGAAALRRLERGAVDKARLCFEKGESLRA